MMIWIDYTIIALIAISAVIGLFRGFIKEAFSLLLWLIAIWIGINFSRDFSVYLVPMIDYPSVRIMVSFAFLFLITLVIGSLISFLLSELIDKTGLSGSDRFVGMIFGIFRGVVVVSLIITFAGFTPLPEDRWWHESTLIPPFQKLAIWFSDHLPTEINRYIHYR